MVLGGHFARWPLADPCTRLRALRPPIGAAEKAICLLGQPFGLYTPSEAGALAGGHADTAIYAMPVGANELKFGCRLREGGDIGETMAIRRSLAGR